MTPSNGVGVGAAAVVLLIAFGSLLAMGLPIATALMGIGSGLSLIALLGQAIRTTDYLPHDGSRPHLALGVDPLAELRVADAGDVLMPPGETEKSLRRHRLAAQAAGGFAGPATGRAAARRPPRSMRP